MLIRYIAFVAILFTSTAQAQVYRCEFPDGSVVFTDLKCGNNAQVLPEIPDNVLHHREERLPAAPTPSVQAQPTPQQQAVRPDIVLSPTAPEFLSFGERSALEQLQKLERNRHLSDVERIFVDAEKWRIQQGWYSSLSSNQRRDYRNAISQLGGTSGEQRHLITTVERLYALHGYTFESAYAVYSEQHPTKVIIQQNVYSRPHWRYDHHYGGSHRHYKSPYWSGKHRYHRRPSVGIGYSKWHGDSRWHLYFGN